MVAQQSYTVHAFPGGIGIRMFQQYWTANGHLTKAKNISLRFCSHQSRFKRIGNSKDCRVTKVRAYINSAVSSHNIYSLGFIEIQPVMDLAAVPVPKHMGGLQLFVSGGKSVSLLPCSPIHKHRGILGLTYLLHFVFYETKDIVTSWLIYFINLFSKAKIKKSANYSAQIFTKYWLRKPRILELIELQNI